MHGSPHPSSATPSAPGSAQLWSAPAAVEQVDEAVAPRPTFEGVRVDKDRWGRAALVFSVEEGETSSQLSRRCGVDVTSLARHNQLANPDRLQVGQQISIPTTFHEVKPGETYWGIAQRLGLDHRVLMELNGARPDGLIRLGQELRVPASIVTPRQVALRSQLAGLLDAAARAESKMFFGPGAFRPYHVGNDLGYRGVADTELRYQFSDDFRTLRIYAGQTGELKGVPLDDPAADVRRLLTTGTLRSMGHLAAAALRERCPEYPGAFNVLGPRRAEDGTVKLTLTGPADGDVHLSYDPRAGTLSIAGDHDRPWTGPVSGPEDVVDVLAARFGLKLPLYAG